MGLILYKIKSKFLDLFGNIRISKYPPFVYYDDTVFAMDGEHIKKALNIAKPGYVILRGYDCYLDGLFIKSSRKYSHAGLVVENGKVIHAVSPNVEKIDMIDFMQCDRIAILKPRKYLNGAVAIAKKYLKENVPYDFGFTHGEETLYCFELAACCYPKLSIKKKIASILCGLIKKKEPVYLSDSFFDSKDFELVYEFNPRYNIDYCKR